MKNNASLTYNLFLIVGDFLALVAAFGGAYILRVTLDARPLIEAIPAWTYLGVFLALLPFWLIIFGLLGLYSSNIYEKRFSEIGRLFIGSFIGLLFVIAVDFAYDKPIFPARLVPLYGFGLAFAFVVIFRNLARLIRTMLFGYNRGLTNVLIVGDNRLTTELVESLMDSRSSGYRIVGVVSQKERANELYPHLAQFDTFELATKKIGAEQMHSIVQTELYARPDKNNVILDFAQQNHIAYRFVPGNTELFVGNIQVELFRASIPVVAVHQTALIGWGRIVKRLFDVVVSSLILVITSPLMAIIALLQKLSGGRVFFRQTRLTRFNQEFQVYKFRTVRPAYNGLSPEEAFAKMGKSELTPLYRENGDQLPHDPRYGRLGNILRKSSLDELPQLFNVLKGDLSLVGPRALVPEELGVYAKKHAILSVKSGLTGLAQVSGRRNINFDERRKLDMYYVQNWTFWLDLVILIKTFRAVVGGRNTS